MTFETPQGWRVATLAECAAPVPNAIVDGPFGSSMKVSDYVEDGIPVLQGKNLTDDHFRWLDIRFISEAKAAVLKRSAVRVGDVLIVKIGSIGYTALLDDLNGYDHAIIPANLAKVTPNPKVVDTAYLLRWLGSPEAKHYLVRSASQTAQPALSLGKIKSLPVPLPPLPEQRRIAAVLDKADDLRAKRKAANDRTRGLLRALFFETFGNPATNPLGFPAAPLGALAAKVSDGPFGSHLKTSHYRVSGIRVIRLQNIGVGEFVDGDKVYVSEEHFADLRKHECRPGDVLIGTLGDPNLRACIQPAWLTVALNKADCVQLRPDQRRANANYLCSLINQPETERMAQSLILGQTRLRISMGRLRGLVVPVPPLDLQNRFSAQVRHVERMKAIGIQSLEAMNALFASLQHRAFRGEL